MGLDMHLYAEKYISAWPHQEENEKKTFRAILDAVGLDPSDLPQGHGPSGYVKLEVAYWRKANCIHRWFVQHVQSGEDQCEPHYVSRDKLVELVEVCKKVKADMAHAAELLPTQSGFFFGGTGYGDDYISDLDITVAQLQSILINPKFTDAWTFLYQSSW